MEEELNEEMMQKTTVWRRLVMASVALSALWGGTLWAQDEAPEKPKYNAYEEFSKGNKYASYGSYSRAIPHYQKALAADPITYNIAHYNLAELYRAKKDCANAVFHYRAYLVTGDDAESLELSRKSIAECPTTDWAKLGVTVQPAEGATVLINGAIFSREGKVAMMDVAPGEYTIEVSAPQMNPQSRTIDLLAKQDTDQLFELEKQTFYGTISVKVDKPGATIKLIPKELAKPELSQGDVVLSSPMTEAAKLPTGKYLLEVTLDGYDRWIRHIYVTRDQETPVEVRLNASLPVELRAK